MNDYIFDVTKNLVYDMRAKDWCKLPYPNHKKGCPNYNKNPDCPPQSPNIEEFIKINRKKWFIVECFDLEKHRNKMKKKHPEWTDKKCNCLLYWQKGVRKRLIEKCIKFISGNKDLIYTLLPESMGVHVFNTAKSIGIPIKRNPNKKVFKIALVGYKNFDDIQTNILKYCG